MNTDCARLSALAPASGLGALDPDEAAFVRAHLAACSRPHPEMREAMALAAAIGAAWPDEDLPSATLRDRILAAAREDGRDAVPAVASATRRSPWRPVAFASAALALAASFALAVQIGQNTALEDRLGDTETRLEAAASDLAAAEAWIQRAVARGANAYFMDGEGAAAAASFMLVVEAEAAGGLLLMSGLPELPAEETYELWVERDGMVVAVGTFVPDARGLAAVPIDGSLAGIRQAMVTVEPAGGSEVPSDGEIIMQGELAL